MRRLKVCVLFVVSTYISRVMNENVRNMAKTKIQKYKFFRKIIYHLVGHEIMNRTLYFVKCYHFQTLTYLRNNTKKWNKIECIN